MDTEESHTRQDIRKKLEPFFDDIVDTVDQMVDEADGLGDVDFEDFEDTLQQQGEALMRKGCELGLEALDPEAERCLIDGAEYYKFMTSETAYRSKWGEIPIERGLFREKGVHNGPSACPLELRAGTVGSWTPACARTIGEFVQELPAEVAAGLSDVPYSSSTFQRVGRRLGGDWKACRADLQPAVSEDVDVPEEAASVSVLVDRVSVLMREGDAYNWRMLWCGAVCLHDREGDTLQTWRYGAVPEHLDEAVRRPMRRDVEAILDDRPNLERIALGDGGSDVCGFLDEEFAEWERRLDFMHVTEKIGAALRCWSDDHATTRQASDVLGGWKLDLLNDDGAIEDIETSIRRWTRSRNSEKTDKAIDATLTYIENHRDEMRYASIREKGLPVGSGAIEATCKSLVALRMKRNGQSWSYSGAQAILNLRSLALSDRWEAGMDALMETYRSSVTPLPAQAA